MVAPYSPTDPDAPPPAPSASAPIPIPKPVPAPGVAARKAVATVGTEAAWEAVMRSRPSVVYVVDFYADWCGPCKALAPFFERLAATHGVPGVLEFLKVNVDDVPEAAVQANISAMPTFQIWRGGELQAEIVGGSQDKLVAIVGKAAALAGV